MSEPTNQSSNAPTAVRGSDVELLSHTLLSSYWPSERRVILLHRFYLSLELQRETTIEEALSSWEAGPCRQWRREKMLRDSRQQICEIERHKYLLSQRAGHDIGWEAAARDWIEHHAAAWREWWEEQPDE